MPIDASKFENFLNKTKETPIPVDTVTGEAIAIALHEILGYKLNTTRVYVTKARTQSGGPRYLDRASALKVVYYLCLHKLKGQAFGAISQPKSYGKILDCVGLDDDNVWGGLIETEAGLVKKERIVPTGNYNLANRGQYDRGLNCLLLSETLIPKKKYRDALSICVVKGFPQKLTEEQAVFVIAAIRDVGAKMLPHTSNWVVPMEDKQRIQEELELVPALKTLGANIAMTEIQFKDCLKTARINSHPDKNGGLSHDFQVVQDAWEKVSSFLKTR